MSETKEGCYSIQIHIKTESPENGMNDTELHIKFEVEDQQLIKSEQVTEDDEKTSCGRLAKTEIKQEYDDTLIKKEDIFKKEEIIEEWDGERVPVVKMECVMGEDIIECMDDMNAPNNATDIIEGNTSNSYECTICNIMFMDADTLSMHMQIHLSAEDTLEIIDKQAFIISQPLESIELMNTYSTTNKTNYEERELFSCQVCNKVFSSSFKLKRHHGIHIRQDSLECKVCNRKFSQYRYLLKHEKKHKEDYIKEKEYFKCTVCDEMFKAHFDLLKHRTTHSVDNIYKCKSCDKVFIRKEQLRIHKKTHVMNSI